jgi:hypothetical protein
VLRPSPPTASLHAQEPFALPAGLALILADVAGGSETPGMVRQVLAWRDAGSGGGAPEDAAAVAALDASPLDAAALTAAAAAGAAVAQGPLLWRRLAAANARAAAAVEALRGAAARAIAAGR